MLCRECGDEMSVVDLMRLPKPYQCEKCCQVEESAELVKNDKIRRCTWCGRGIAVDYQYDVCEQCDR